MNTVILKPACMLVIGLLFGTCTAQTILYVDGNLAGVNACGDRDGSSWEAAYGDLQCALARARALGTEPVVIRVAGGANLVYPTGLEGATVQCDPLRTFEMRSELRIEGGWTVGITDETDPDARQPWILPTRLTGVGFGDIPDCGSLQPRHVVTATNCTNVEIIGVIITNGKAIMASGGGMYIEHSDVTVRESQIIANEAAMKGGGVYASDSSVNFINCLFGKTNVSDQFGGHVAIVDTDATARQHSFTRCQFGEGGGFAGEANIGGGAIYYEANVASRLDMLRCSFNDSRVNSVDPPSKGGHLYIASGRVLAVACDFLTAQSEGDGAGAYVSQGAQAVFHDTLVAQNATIGIASRGAGVYSEGDVVFSSCTIAANMSGSQATGAGLFSTANTVISNTILWDNMSDPGQSTMSQQVVAPSVSQVHRSCIAGGPWPTGDGNIASDPHFVSRPSSAAFLAPTPTFRWTSPEEPNVKSTKLSYSYLIRFDSRCRNAGDNTLVPADLLDLDADSTTSGEPLPLDRQGYSRFYPQPACVNPPPARIDIGAFENVECIADMNRDGGVTIDDLLIFLFHFEAGNLEADVDDGTCTGSPDGGVTPDDLLAYLAYFEAGC